MVGELLPSASPELAAELAVHVAAGAGAWPDLAIAPERFARYLASRVAGDTEPIAALRGLHVADLYLACACVDGDSRALAIFDRDYLARLSKVIARAGTDRGSIDEVRQRLAERLLVATDGQAPRLERYGGRGPLVTWLRVVARRALSNLRRSSDGRAAVHDKAADELDEVVALDPELALIRQRFGVSLREALAAAFASLEPRERNLLRMHFVDRLGIDQLAPIFSVSRATAARHLAAARQALAERTVTNLCARLKLSATELDSLIRKVHSKLDVSLTAVLATSAGTPDSRPSR